MTRDEHPDDGTIHAWLDGALDPHAAEALAAHVESCASCAARVAEARGLIAGASRVIGALDDAPGAAPAWGTRDSTAAADSGAARSAWRRLRLTPARAAIAATLLVAAGVTLTYERTGPDTVSEARARAAAENAAGMAAATLQPLVAPDTSPAMRVAAGRAATQAVRESTSALVDRARTTAASAAPGAPPLEARVVGPLEGRAPGMPAEVIDSAANRHRVDRPPRPTVQTATTTPIPTECYRIESANGAPALWGSVEVPFIIALDASGGGGRVLTADGAATGTLATWSRGGADSVLVRLRRVGFEGSLALGKAADVRAGVMRSAPLEVGLNEVVVAAASGDSNPRRPEPRPAQAARSKASARTAAPTRRRATTADASARATAPGATAPAAPAVPIVARATACPSR